MLEFVASGGVPIRIRDRPGRAHGEGSQGIVVSMGPFDEVKALRRKAGRGEVGLSASVAQQRANLARIALTSLVRRRTPWRSML